MVGQEHAAGGPRDVKPTLLFRSLSIRIEAGLRSGRSPIIALKMRQMINVAGHEEDAIRNGLGHIRMQIDQSGVAEAQRVGAGKLQTFLIGVRRRAQGKSTPHFRHESRRHFAGRDAVIWPRRAKQR